MRVPLSVGDVAVRARGLAIHLLDRATLLRLARSAGSGALARALEDLGYWPAPSTGAPMTAAAVIDRSIDHQTGQRLAILDRWLGDRRSPFAPLFELELRDMLRIRLRELVAGGLQSGEPARILGGWPELRGLRAALTRAADLPELVRALTRSRSPYAEPIRQALHARGDDPRSLETALDRAWAQRARSATASAGGALRAWVHDEIDLHNAWSALVGVGDSFLEGGSRLSRTLHASIAAGSDEPARRRRLAEAFSGGPLNAVFDAPERSIASLEARSRAARIAAARRASRLEPIGASPVVEVVLRLRAERADLRCISRGIAAGLSYETIVDRLAVAS